MHARETKRVKYFEVPTYRKVVCTTQRAASASMVESLRPMSGGGTSQITPGRVIKLRKSGWDVLLWLREPYARIACAYKVYGKRFVSVEAFLEHILTNTNPHWSPQIALHTDAGLLLPTVVYPFEKLATTWAHELPGHPLQHVGANPERLDWAALAVQASKSTLARVYLHWLEDLQWHERLLKHGFWQRFDKR